MNGQPDFAAVVGTGSLRVQDKSTSHSEGQLYQTLRTLLNREILNGSRNRLRFRSIIASESNDSFTPNPAKYFCPGPLVSFYPANKGEG